VYVVRNPRGGRISRQRIAEIVREAAALASEAGAAAAAADYAHSLHRTYIPIALLANGLDVKCVMSHVGHADSKMTLDVYTQLGQRIKRDHGVRFDALIRAGEHE